MRARGHATVFVALVVAIISCAVMASFWRSSWSISEHAIFWISVVVLSAGLLVEFRHDARQAAQFVLLFGTIALLGSGFIVLADVRPTPIANALLAVSLAVDLCCVATLWRIAHTVDPIPNPLLDQLGRDAVWEVEGIQFSVSGPDRAVANEPSELTVAVLNCWDAPREVTVRVRATELIAAETPPLLLRDLEGGVLTIPFALAYGPTSADLSVTVDVTGAGGKRIRRRRGKPASRPVSPWLQVAGALAGSIVWGGGLFVRVQVQAGHTSERPPLLASRWQPFEKGSPSPLHLNPVI